MRAAEEQRAKDAEALRMEGEKRQKEGEAMRRELEALRTALLGGETADQATGGILKDVREELDALKVGSPLWFLRSGRREGHAGGLAWWLLPRALLYAPKQAQARGDLCGCRAHGLCSAPQPGRVLRC